MAQDLITLTEDQKKIALEYCTKEDLSLLTRRIFGDVKLDGRTLEGRSVKTFLAGENINIITTKFVPTVPLELTEDQKKKVEELSLTVESTLELARLVFNDPKLKHLSREWRAVFQYYREICPSGVTASEEPVEIKDYIPPLTLRELTTQVNEYIPTGDVDKKLYIWGKLKISEERQLRKLMSYIRIYRFKYLASEFQRKSERDLFISTFFRFTHDKADLTEEEVDQYVSAAAETVNISSIERELRMIIKVVEEMLNGDADSRRASMATVELINVTRSKLDQSKGRLASLLESLVGSRNKRLKDRDQRNASILNLFDAWMKDETMRNDIIELGIQEHEADAREVGRIKSLDDMTAIICGMTEDEASVG